MRQEIEAVVQRFFDASYAADPVKMETVFHDGFQFFGFDADKNLVKRDKEQFVEGYRRNSKDSSWPDYPRVNEIVSIDFTGENTAVARTKIRIRSTLYTDIFCFMRIGGEWRIISKVAAGVPIE
jgi:hypothetical protein